MTRVRSQAGVRFGPTHTKPIPVYKDGVLVGKISGSSGPGWCLYEGVNLIRCSSWLADVKTIAREHYSGRK